MFGSIDYIHWAWNNYLTTWLYQFTRRCSIPIVILEVVTDKDLTFWNHYFRSVGFIKDLMVMYTSNIFSQLAKGGGSICIYVLNGR